MSIIKQIGLVLLGSGLMAFSPPSMAALNIFATVPEWGSLAQAIGGAHIQVFTATTALQDPHRIEAKPSLIARARRADLVIATGADLEIGWLPMVLQESNNGRIQAGMSGYFAAADFVRKLDVPNKRVDRADGDVHAHGNPHIHLNPHNVLKVADALQQRMSQLDPTSAADYQRGYQVFADRWKQATIEWEKRAAKLKGVPVLVQHKSFSYLVNWLNLQEVGTLEPKPGIEPTPGQLSEIVARQKNAPARMILRPIYQYDATARWVSDRTSIPVVSLAFTVGGTPAANDLFGLFDDTLSRLISALDKPNP